MKKLILISFITIISFPAFSQHETDNWYFGVLAGLNFSSGMPVALSSGVLVTNEGCSTISDSSGNLLFYTDGITVWNKFNQVMPNGSGLLGGISSTQSALIVPLPGSNTQYYIFTVDEIGGPNGFRYSIVDMTLQSNNGDVTSSKNILIQNNVTERLAAVSQLDSANYWVVVHEWGSNAFYSYNLNAAGLSSLPVISNTGIIHTTDSIQNTYGQMKFNTCGTKIALAAGYLDTAEVFDFDPVTGIVSNPITLPMGNHLYGLEFSKDGDKLYITKYINGASSFLVQLDLSLGTQAAILASEIAINTTFDPDYLYGMQLAADGKIYVSKNFKQFLGVINNPELAGAACNYVDNGVDLDPNFMGITSSLSLPGFVASYLRGEVHCSSVGIAENNFGDDETIIYPNPSSDDFTLHIYKAENFPSEILIYDQTGRMIEQLSPKGNNSDSFHFGKSFSPGIYIVRINNPEEQRVIKVVKIQ